MKFIASMRGWAAALLVVAICLSPSHAMDLAGSGYRLGPGDKVKVTVFGHTDLSGVFTLDASGRISMPLIQSVEALDLSQSELEGLITGRLRPDYLVNPRVSVEVLGYRPFFIVGEVNNSGDYPYQSDLTILRAIALAGGYTERANTRKVYITRADDPEQKKHEASADTRVGPGDIVTIPARFF